ncbi:MAG TPA: hypothetical protein VIU12_09095 [Chryseolinea sp.]
MKKVTIALFFSIISPASFAQTDTEIVHAILGKNYYRANNILDSLGVWYYYHFHENTSTTGKEIKPKPYSIANGSGVVKVFILDIHPTRKFVQKITINYRHDSKEQVEDLKKISSADDYHVGTYSTDVTFKRKE